MDRLICQKRPGGGGDRRRTGFASLETRSPLDSRHGGFSLLAGPTGIEPVAFGFEAGQDGSSTGCSPMQAPAITADAARRQGWFVSPDAGECNFLVTSLLHTDVTVSERPRMCLPLLSVRQVAGKLGVCTATVYALCAKGVLPHVRLLNAIRIEVGDLEALVEGRRSKAPRREARPE